MRKNGHIEDNILDSKCPKKRICVKKVYSKCPKKRICVKVVDQKNAYSVKKAQ